MTSPFLIVLVFRTWRGRNWASKWSEKIVATFALTLVFHVESACGHPPQEEESESSLLQKEEDDRSSATGGFSSNGSHEEGRRKEEDPEKQEESSNSCSVGSNFTIQLFVEYYRGYYVYLKHNTRICHELKLTMSCSSFSVILWQSLCRLRWKMERLRVQGCSLSDYQRHLELTISR